MSTNSRQIFTLDARDNVLLEVVSQDIDQVSIYNLIGRAFDELISLLDQKGINYVDLKNALIPQGDKREIALIFDRMQIESCWYGNDVFKQVIPLLNGKSSHSILVGDMLGPENAKEKIKSEFFKNIIQARKPEYRDSNQFYIVYINNLSDEMVRSLNDGLSEYVPYVGYFDLTYDSFLKTYLSTVLTNCCLKARGTVIFGHEEDRDDSENVNIPGYSFEENGYECKSVNVMYYGLFLSYKIERQAFPEEKDTKFSINALTADIHMVSDLDVFVEDKKLAYLLKEREANLKRAELLDVTPEELARFIKGKIEGNYIYNLTYRAESDTLKFNVMINVQGKKIDRSAKLLASLEYQPKIKSLRLITLF